MRPLPRKQENVQQIDLETSPDFERIIYEHLRINYYFKCNSDVSVHFGGKFETKWTDAHMQYSSQSVIYAEEQRVIRNRKIPLDCRWYRFDFEHRIPSSLPTSFKHHEGRLLFYASGVLLRDNGALLETLNAHFHVKGRTDIDGLPAVLHESVRRKQSRVFEKCPSATRQKQHNHNHNAIGLESARAPLRHDEDDDVTSLDSDGEQRQVKAAISLNSQAFAHGQHVIAEVTLDNSTNGQVSYTAKFEQVMTFEADFVRPSVGGQRNPTAQVPHSKTSSKVLAASPLIRVDPGCTEASSCMFDIPAVIPSTPSRYMLPGVSHLGIRRPLITIAYFVKLEIKPEWHEDGFNIPVEIKIGSIDSNIRNQNSPEAEVHDNLGDFTNVQFVWRENQND
ncbi:hypothetical protein CAPTEDRAFT_220151 [Capitella teleta]|uniref:Arrestin C-terminal-like domain-containing protein n=1 Tax=Capitella teleta TaxID=283909 RepID=R7UKF6_CAPTE|nr:hypothetical protein CAPTEDRAFT_220151 [Capitella teleta]|eukprot:ELU06695.1 hypothetical protein CAPTEDRAFT_220151 [Capitella teleta]